MRDGRCRAERGIAIRENREHAAEAGDFEDLPDRVVQRAQFQAAAAAVELLGQRQQHAQAGAADVTDVSKVDHEVFRAGSLQVLQSEFEIRRRLCVEAARQNQNANFADFLLADGKAVAVKH